MDRTTPKNSQLKADKPNRSLVPVQNLVKPPNHLNPSKQTPKSLHINTPQLATIEVELKKDR
jgi:hypothetical protein